MKSYRWLTLIAALLITVCEVLVFESQAGQAPQQRAHGAVVAGVGSSTHSPGWSHRDGLQIARTNVWGGHETKNRSSVSR